MPTPPDATSTHDPGPEGARERAERIDRPAAALRTPGGAVVRFGTAGWTDRTLTAAGVFYPESARTPETRLRHYASMFSMVEVDATYYALPTSEMAERWAERTPDDFVFDVKAHALMTGHGTEPARLPATLRAELPRELAERRRVKASELPPALLDEVWRFFLLALEPLQRAGKLGSVLLQYPPWFAPTKESARTIVEATARLRDAGVRGAVELRNARWFEGRLAERTPAFLREHDIPFVMVDEPQGHANSVPPLRLVTSRDLAIVRFHGRRADVWDRPNVGVAERFRYLYDETELAEWAPAVDEATRAAREVHVVFNNCYANYGTTNAMEMAAVVRAALR